MIHIRDDKNGFALLLTLVVVSVVLAIGLTLVDITLKQLTLSGTGRESEIAFHAAHAGAECAGYAATNNPPADFVGYPPASPPDLNCFAGVLESSSSGYGPEGPSDRVHHYEYEYDWSDTANNIGRCTQIDYYVFDAVTDTADISYNISAFDPGVDEECEANRYCTFVLSRGYNRACSDIGGGQRVIQREVLLSF